MGRVCKHPLEVGLKFDEMAQYVIDQGLEKEIPADFETLHNRIMKEKRQE